VRPGWLEGLRPDVRITAVTTTAIRRTDETTNHRKRWDALIPPRSTSRTDEPLARLVDSQFP